MPPITPMVFMSSRFREPGSLLQPTITANSGMTTIEKIENRFMALPHNYYNYKACMVITPAAMITSWLTQHQYSYSANLNMGAA